MIRFELFKSFLFTLRKRHLLPLLRLQYNPSSFLTHQTSFNSLFLILIKI